MSHVKEYVSEMAAEKVEHDLRRSKSNIAQELWLNSTMVETRRS
jgi:hypothetical protein